MNPRKVIICIGLVFCFSIVITESKTASEVETGSSETVLLGKNVRPKSGSAYSYPTPILFSNGFGRYYGFGKQHFLSYTAHFCKHETDNGTLEVVSVGSGDGSIENDTIEAYANHFGGELRITLVDPDPACSVDFQTVDDLIAKSANVVRNCIILIIWPEVEQKNDGYDIQAIRKLQPRAVLTIYEMTGISGSSEFRACLNPPGIIDYAGGEECSPRLTNYVIEEIAYQQVNHDPGPMKFFNETINVRTGLPSARFRLVKLKRTN